MAATEVPAVTTTESAPVEEVSLQERLNAATEEEYKTWERTGDIPPIKPKAEPKIETPPAKKEASAASTEAPSADETEESAKPETAPVTEPGKPQKKRNGDARILQLLEENKREREEWAARVKELEEKIAKPAAADVKPTSSPAADGKTEIKASDKAPLLGDVNPKTGKPYQTIAEWQEDYSAWLLARNTSEVEARFTKAEQQRAQAEQERILNEDWTAKVQSAREKHADFDTVALNQDLIIPRFCPADLYIRNSEHGAEILYYLGQHPEIASSFVRETTAKGSPNRTFEDVIHPSLQYAELARIEARLTGTSPAPAAPKPVTSAPAKPLPPPPTVLSAKNTVSGDPAEEAIKNKSFADYEKAANAAERKARRA